MYSRSIACIATARRIIAIPTLDAIANKVVKDLNSNVIPQIQLNTKAFAFYFLSVKQIFISSDTNRTEIKKTVQKYNDVTRFENVFFYKIRP